MRDSHPFRVLPGGVITERLRAAVPPAKPTTADAVKEGRPWRRWLRIGPVGEDLTDEQLWLLEVHVEGLARRLGRGALTEQHIALLERYVQGLVRRHRRGESLDAGGAR
jgi:hypothetical protein